MTTQKVNTRFMDGHKTSEVFDILVEKFGMIEVVHSPVDFEEAIYSAGFIHAIESGLTPVSLEVIPSHLSKRNAEYHHVIIDNECYVMYFEKA